MGFNRKCICNWEDCRQYQNFFTRRDNKGRKKEGPVEILGSHEPRAGECIRLSLPINKAHELLKRDLVLRSLGLSPGEISKKDINVARHHWTLAQNLYFRSKGRKSTHPVALDVMETRNLWNATNRSNNPMNESSIVVHQEIRYLLLPSCPQSQVKQEVEKRHTPSSVLVGESGETKSLARETSKTVKRIRAPHTRNFTERDHSSVSFSVVSGLSAFGSGLITTFTPTFFVRAHRKRKVKSKDRDSCQSNQAFPGDLTSLACESLPQCLNETQSIDTNHRVESLPSLVHICHKSVGASTLTDSLCHEHSPGEAAMCTSMDFSGQTLVRERADFIAYELQMNVPIIALNLTNTGLGNAGAKVIAAAIKVNCTLTRLHLGHNKIGDTGAESVAKSLETNRSLKALDLIFNRIGEKGAKAIAAAIKLNCSLCTLNLQRNVVCDGGVLQIAETLSSNKSLTILNLSYNSISDAGGNAIAVALRLNSTLKVLDLANNHIGQFARNAIRSNQCKVFF